jgi:hypothetical protein
MGTDDGFLFRSFTKMSECDCNHLLQLVSPVSSKQCTNYCYNIPSGTGLATTLWALAIGRLYHSLVQGLDKK